MSDSCCHIWSHWCISKGLKRFFLLLFIIINIIFIIFILLIIINALKNQWNAGSTCGLNLLCRDNATLPSLHICTITNRKYLSPNLFDKSHSDKWNSYFQHYISSEKNHLLKSFFVSVRETRRPQKTGGGPPFFRWDFFKEKFKRNLVWEVLVTRRWRVRRTAVHLFRQISKNLFLVSNIWKLMVATFR